MIPLDVKEVLKRVKGKITQGNPAGKIQYVTVNPNDIQKNTLFFYTSDKKFNWGSLPFSESLIIVTKNPEHIAKLVSKNVTLVKVKNLEDAYWDFVRYYRKLLDIPIIGVTGTCGKTSTTEIIKHILSHRYEVKGTQDGKNNLSNNLPYLLDLDKTTEAAVFEMGVSHPGCISNSCRHFRPQVGVILNIGVYHLLGCKTFENYLNAKAEMVQGIAQDGTLIINADDENIRKIDMSTFQGQIVTFGIREKSHYQAREITYVKNGMNFTLQVGSKIYPMFVHGYGKHNVYNALAALAAVHAIGIDLQNAGKWLSTFKQLRQHMELKRGRRGCILIDDTWNCTPPSMSASLKVLQEMTTDYKKVAILGYMPQLGENGKNEYDKVAQKVLDAGVHHVVVIGEAQRIGRKLLELGMDKNRIDFCETGEDVYMALQPILDQDVLLLCKFPYKYRLSKIASFRNLMEWLIDKHS